MTSFQLTLSITHHLVPRFSDPLHGIELPRLRLLVTLALPPFLGRLGLWVAYLTRRLEASGVVGRRNDAEALVGPVEDADRIEEGGSGAGAGDVEAVDAGGLERPQLVGDFHLRQQRQGFGWAFVTLNPTSESLVLPSFGPARPAAAAAAVGERGQPPSTSGKRRRQIIARARVWR